MKEVKAQVNHVEVQEVADIILGALREKNVDFFVGIFVMQLLVKSAEREYNFRSETYDKKVEVN